VRREPEAIKKYLTRDQYRLYDLIWKRFVASQMAPAIYDTISVDVAADSRWQVADGAVAVPDDQLSEIGGKPEYLFRASGSRVKFPGFLVVYEEAKDEDAVPDEGEGKILPPLSKGEILDLLRLCPQQHFTQPPPRYTEATLVRTLEEYGIGRPSTYAPIISTIQNRGYVERVNRHLQPTEIGFTVNDLLVKYFPGIVDVGFTARMEEDLDLIASGKRRWVPVLRDFYGPFEKTLQHAEKHMENLDLGEQPTGEVCEKCGHPMIVKWGRYGKFIACSNYPACRNTKPFQVKIGVACPQCGGDLVEKKTRRRRVFYGCSNYPECEFASWKRPLPQPCPACGGLLVEAGKEQAKCIQCEEQVELEKLKVEASVEGSEASEGNEGAPQSPQSPQFP
jgi:DNA topoisomerase-1